MKMSRPNSEDQTSAAKTKRPFYRTLFGQLSLALIVFLLLINLVQLLTVRFTVLRSDDVFIQYQLWDVAKTIGAIVEEIPPEEIHQINLQQKFRQFQTLNPSLEIFLLRPDGSVVFESNQGDVRIGYSRKPSPVDVAPILKFLSGSASELAPLYGDDPHSHQEKAVFSAARIKLAGDEMYLYTILRGRSGRLAQQLYDENFSALYISLATASSGFAVVALGIALFYFFSRRVSHTVSVIRDFQTGNKQARIRSNSNDELGDLAKAFDEMAEKVVGSIAQLEDRDALRRDLIATISHDLRGPLTNISAHLERLRMDSSTGRAQESIEILQRNSKDLEELLEQLFELASLEAKENLPEPEETLLDIVFTDLALSYGPRAEAKGIRLRAEDEEKMTVLIDLTMLTRILNNLVENALKFTEEGGTITVRATREGERARISVSDTGSGIAESELPKIFEKFFQGESGKIANLSSCGLGLSIVRRLVELQGSVIQVKSAVGVGTEFFFFIKLGEPSLRK